MLPMALFSALLTKSARDKLVILFESREQFQKPMRIPSKGQKLGMIGIKLLQMPISYFWGK